MKKVQYNVAIVIEDKIKKLESWKSRLLYIKDNNGYIIKDSLVIDPILTNELEYIQKITRDLIKKSIEDSIDRLNKEFDEL